MARGNKGSLKQKGFLAAFASTASITKAAEAIQADRKVHYQWLRHDPTYPARFAEAKEEAAQLLEDEAVRRAHVGVEEPVFWKGKRTGKITVYSDALMMFLLRGFKPQKYRERASVEVSGMDGAPPIAIDARDARLATLTDDELTQLIALSKKLTPETTV